MADGNQPFSVEDLPGLFGGSGERLLPVHGLAVGDGLEGHVGVRRRDSQVEHQVDVVRRQQLFHRHCPDAFVGVRHCLGTGRIEVRHGHEVDRIKAPEIAQVLGDDGAAADDSDVKLLGVF